VNFFGGPESGTCAARHQSHSLRRHHAEGHLPSHAGHLPPAFELIAGGNSSAERFITGHAPLSDLNQAFAQLLIAAIMAATSRPPILPHGAGAAVPSRSVTAGNVSTETNPGTRGAESIDLA
jgi:hypothetical protein